MNGWDWSVGTGVPAVCNIGTWVKTSGRRGRWHSNSTVCGGDVGKVGVVTPGSVLLKCDGEFSS